MVPRVVTGHGRCREGFACDWCSFPTVRTRARADGRERCVADWPSVQATTWTILEVALPPDAPGTGNVFAIPRSVINNTLLPPSTGTALLTSGARLGVCDAGDVNVESWTLLSSSSVVPPPPASANCSMIGDVYVTVRQQGEDNATWGVVVASSTGDGFNNGAPAALLYESSDLKHW